MEVLAAMAHCLSPPTPPGAALVESYSAAGGYAYQ